MRVAILILGLVGFGCGASVPHAVNWTEIQNQITEYRSVLHVMVPELKLIIGADTNDEDCRGNLTQPLIVAEENVDVILAKIEVEIANETLTEPSAVDYFDDKIYNEYNAAEVEIRPYLVACLTPSGIIEFVGTLYLSFDNMALKVEKIYSLLREEI